MKVKKNTIYLGLAILGVAILIYILFFNSSGGGGGSWSLWKKEATCTVKVVNPLLSLGELEIESSTCTSRKTLICNPLNILAITSTSGYLEFTSEGIKNSIGITVSGVPYRNSKEFKISVCGMSAGTTNGMLDITIDNEITDSQEVNFP